jgi:hypothetical protein
VFLLLTQHLDAGELLLQIACPVEAGLDGRPLGADVVPVQWVTNLEPQGVARPEPARDDAGVEDRIPERRGVVGRAAELAAAFACVAGAGDQAVHSQDIAFVKREGRDLDPKPRKRLRPLHGKEGPVGGDVFRLRESRMVRLDVRGVHDEEIVVRTPAVGDEIVDDPALVVREQGVLRVAVVHLVEVVREAGLQVVVGAVPGDPELPHVRDVEDAGRGPDSPMLAHDGRVLNRHLPASKGDEARAESGVALVQRRAPKRLHRGGSYR